MVSDVTTFISLATGIAGISAGAWNGLWFWSWKRAKDAEINKLKEDLNKSVLINVRHDTEVDTEKRFVNAEFQKLQHRVIQLEEVMANTAKRLDEQSRALEDHERKRQEMDDRYRNEVESIKQLSDQNTNKIIQEMRKLHYGKG